MESMIDEIVDIQEKPKKEVTVKPVTRREPFIPVNNITLEEAKKLSEDRGIKFFNKNDVKAYEPEDSVSFDYNSEVGDYSYLVGKTMRNPDWTILGVIREVEHAADGHGHLNAICVVDSVRGNELRINCRNLLLEGV